MTVCCILFCFAFIFWTWKQADETGTTLLPDFPNYHVPKHEKCPVGIILQIFVGLISTNESLCLNICSAGKTSVGFRGIITLPEILLQFRFFMSHNLIIYQRTEANCLYQYKQYYLRILRCYTARKVSLITLFCKLTGGVVLMTLGYLLWELSPTAQFCCQGSCNM